MKTVYVDIYFLINFSVDLLSLHMASRFTKIPVSGIRMLLGAAVGGIYAVLLVFLPKNPILFSFATVVSGLIIVNICASKCAKMRKIKYFAAFLFFEIIIGGTVYFIYGILERNIEYTIIDENGTNRNVLILSLVVLLSIGVLKLFLSLFKNTVSEKSVELKILLFDKEYLISALVDTGNLASDPLDLTPVTFLSNQTSNKLMKGSVPYASVPESLDEKTKKRIRLIPITVSGKTKILYAIKPDSVYVIRPYGCEKINTVIAFDKEVRSYGGFEALVPASALDNIK